MKKKIPNKKTKIAVKTADKQPKKQATGKPFVKGDPRINLKGRPEGSLDFKTKFNIFLNKVAKENKMTVEQVEEQLYAAAFTKAKGGSYKFFEDLMNRLYGKPQESLDLTSKGEKIMPAPIYSGKSLTNDKK